MTPADDGLFDRLVEVTLPHGGYVLALYEAYFDESGTDDGSPALCVAGYLIESERARAMDREWRALLARYDLPYFHMVDCAHGAGPFAKLTKQDRIDVATKCIDMIKGLTTRGFAAVTSPPRLEGYIGNTDAYTYCVHMCIGALMISLGPQRADSRIAFFFEAGHQSGSKAHKYVSDSAQNDKLFQANFAGMAFLKKQDAPILQAADILAWQYRKYLADKIGSSRKPMKDFASLMAHEHALLLLGIAPDRLLAVSFCINPHYDNPERDIYIRSLFSAGHDADDALHEQHRRHFSMYAFRPSSGRASGSFGGIRF